MESSAHTMNTLFQQISQGTPGVGSEITRRNPDVEIMAMTLNDTPVSLDGFNSLEGGRGWYNMKFMVLLIGPPGFSSVPYTANKKSGEKEIGKKLYDATEDGHTRFYSYLKGKTNKDRGERVSTFTTEDVVDGDVTAVLAPGMCMTQFIRSDLFEKEFIVGNVQESVIPAFSVVYMQMSSSNCEQAVKGRLLKLRKIKVPTAPTLWQQMIHKLPSSASGFRLANSADANFSIRENIDTRMNSSYFQFEVSKTAFVTKDDEHIVVCDPSENMKEASIIPDALSEILPCADTDQRLKFLNMAIATGSVRMLFKSLNQDDNFTMDSSIDAYPDKVIGVNIDYNNMFGLDVLSTIDFNDVDLKATKKLEAATTGTNKKVMTEWIDGEDILLWFKGDVWGSPADPKRHANSIVFSVKTTCNNNSDNQGLPSSLSIIDRNASGPFYRIRMHMLGTDTLEQFRARLSTNENERCLMTLELRTENRGVTCSRKRKRPALEFELYETE